MRYCAGCGHIAGMKIVLIDINTETPVDVFVCSDKCATDVRRKRKIPKRPQRESSATA